MKHGSAMRALLLAYYMNLTNRGVLQWDLTQ